MIPIFRMIMRYVFRKRATKKLMNFQRNQFVIQVEGEEGGKNLILSRWF